MISVHAVSLKKKLSEHVACAALAAALVVAIRLELPARPFRLLRHRDRYRTRAAEAFSESLNRSANPA